MAKYEEDGQMTLLGRGSVSINSGGEKIFPEEVEMALKAHSNVFDCLVVGVKDEKWGQKVVAVIQRSFSLRNNSISASATVDNLLLVLSTLAESMSSTVTSLF